MRDQSLIVFLALQSLLGCLMAIGFVGAFLVLDVAQLRTILLGSGYGWAWSVVFTFLLAVTFASAQVGFALFSAQRERR